MTDRIIIIKGQTFPILISAAGCIILWLTLLMAGCLFLWDKTSILSQDLRRLEIRVAEESRPLVVTGKYNRVIFRGEEIDSGVTQ